MIALAALHCGCKMEIFSIDIIYRLQAIASKYFLLIQNDMSVLVHVHIG